MARQLAALGMRIIAVKPRPEVRADTSYRVPGTGDPDGSIPERIVGGRAPRGVAREADVLVVTMPLTDASRGVISREVIAALPERAWLINVSRGPLVDETALLEALRGGRLAGAVLDVFGEEPLPPDSPWWDAPNVIVTPHASGDTCASSTTSSSRTSAATSPASRCSTRSTPSADTRRQEDDHGRPQANRSPDSRPTAAGGCRASRPSASTSGNGAPTTSTGRACPGSGSSCWCSAGCCCSQQVFPQFAAVGSVIVLAIGLAFLVKWAIDRGTASLYAGSIITALAVPGLLNAAGVEANGLTTFSLGIAFLFIAAVRLVTGGGVGWQIWFGGLLAVIGGAQIANAPLGGYILPIVLVALGILLIARGGRQRPRAGSDDQAR